MARPLPGTAALQPPVTPPRGTTALQPPHIIDGGLRNADTLSLLVPPPLRTTASQPPLLNDGTLASWPARRPRKPLLTDDD